MYMCNNMCKYGYTPQYACCVGFHCTVCACVCLCTCVCVLNQLQFYTRTYISCVQTLVCALCMISMHSVCVRKCVYICICSESDVIVCMVFHCPVRFWNCMYTIHSQLLYIFLQLPRDVFNSYFVHGDFDLPLICDVGDVR